MSDLREQIAAALDKALPKSAADLGFYHREGATPLVDIEAYDLNLELLADAVIRDVLNPEFLADLMIAAVQKAADDD